jgi:gluconokinase
MSSHAAVEHLPPTPPSEPTTANTTEANDGAPAMALNSRKMEHKHIWVITGPAGCGKTSVAEYLHQTFALPYLEGDTVCSPPRLVCMNSH